TEWITREQSHLGERVDDDPRRRFFLDAAEDDVHRLLQLDLGRMEKRVRLVDARLKLVQLDDVDPVEAPTVRRGGRSELLGGLRKRDVHDAFAGIPTGHQELQAEGRFAGTRFSVEKVEAVRGQAAEHNLVESGDAGVT